MMEKKELVRRTEAEPQWSAWRPFQELEEFLMGDGRAHRFDLLGGRTWAPPVDVEESEKEYVFKAEMPGLEKDDFKVEMLNGVLSISGEKREKKEEKGKNYLRHEQRYGSFRREFSMPNDANPEGIKAAYKNGILTIMVQRLEAARPKAIPVNVG